VTFVSTRGGKRRTAKSRHPLQFISRRAGRGSPFGKLEDVILSMTAEHARKREGSDQDDGVRRKLFLLFGNKKHNLVEYNHGSTGGGKKGQTRAEPEGKGENQNNGLVKKDFSARTYW